MFTYDPKLVEGMKNQLKAKLAKKKKGNPNLLSDSPLRTKVNWNWIPNLGNPNKLGKDFVSVRKRNS